MDAIAMHIIELTWWWGLATRNVSDSEALELGWLLQSRAGRVEPLALAA